MRPGGADEPLVFAIGASEDFGRRVAGHLGLPLAELEERSFEDGEFKIRPLASVRNRRVYVIHSLHGDHTQSANDKLCRLLFFIGALKDAAAAEVTAVVPYLCYSRKDRRTKPRDPVTSRYLAQLFEAIGTDRVITMDVHNLSAFENAYRCQTEHLDAIPLFVSYLAPLIGDLPAAVVSPDAGGAKRAEFLRRELERALGRPVAGAIMEKHRSKGAVTGEIFAGDVAGRTAIIVDDLISTGGTMARTAAACRLRGAERVYVLATHGLFAEGADAVLTRAEIDKIVVTDTVDVAERGTSGFRERLVVLGVAGVFAEAIRRCHYGESAD